MSAPAIRHSMAAAGIPGMALATIDRGEVRIVSMGMTALEAAQPVVETTVFDVASLSKPVAAFIALQLADSGVLDLDKPLAGMIEKRLPPALAASLVTARHVLTHTSGLPNLRGRETLKTWFPPGSWFSYSSVGFDYLQMALEAVTSEPLEALAQRLVFKPLGMRSSSFEWQERFAGHAAVPHDGIQPLEKHRPAAAYASYSLQTTAADYASFMVAVLDGTSLSEATRRLWVTPAVRVPRRDALHLRDSAPQTEQDIAWGLGWGIETAGGTFFQWGKMDGIRALAMGHPETRSGIVLLTHSNRGLRLMNAAAEAVLPGPHPAFAWLRAFVTE